MRPLSGRRRKEMLGLVCAGKVADGMVPIVRFRSSMLAALVFWLLGISRPSLLCTGRPAVADCGS